jgi:UDP-3-O-[3-hydroxymyristoyl] glucosamine N-acyltransferase
MSPHRLSIPLLLSQIQEFIGGEIVGPLKTIISGISSLEEAEPGDLSYCASDRYLKAALQSRAGAFLVGRPIPELNRPQLVVANPAYEFARIAQRFFTEPYRPRGMAKEVVCGAGVQIGPDPSIWPGVTLGDRVQIGARVTLYPGVFIGSDSMVGNDSLLYPNVVVREGCVIGSRVIIHSGTVIGSDGFGFVQHEGRHVKIPQLGGVIIEDDVELGANVAVDRATFGQTVVKKGTKVDNLVQIAHNVTVGEHTILVAQVGIAGSTSIGHHVMIGGQAGLADHVRVGDLAMIAARSGVNRNVESKEVVGGAPAMPFEVFLKSHALIARLPEFRQWLRELKERVQALEKKQAGKQKPKKPGRKS